MTGAQIGIPSPGVAVSGLPGGRLADVLLVSVDEAVNILPTDLAGVRIGVVSGNLGAPEAGIADVDVTAAPSTEWTAVPAKRSAIHRDVDLWLAVAALANARKAIELAVEYTGSRKVFGRPLAEFENTQLRLAELAAELSAATSYVDLCVAARAQTRLTPADAAAARQVTVGLRSGGGPKPAAARRLWVYARVPDSAGIR